MSRQFSRKTSELADYRYRMCYYGKPPFIACFSVTIQGSSCYYRVVEEDLVPFFVEDKPLDRDEILGLFESLVGMIATCREYLLVFDEVLLSDEGILKRKDGSVVFLYYPFFTEPSEDTHSRQRIERLVQKIRRYGDMEDENILGILHPIGIALAEPAFSLEGFEILLKRILEV